MKFILGILLLVSVAPISPIQSDVLPDFEVGFHTDHYRDFVKFFFEGKDDLASQNYYLDWCARDIAFVLKNRMYRNSDNTALHDLAKMSFAEELFNFVNAKQVIGGLAAENDQAQELLTYALTVLEQLEHEWKNK